MQCTTSYNIMHACLTEDVSISKEEEELSCLGAVLLLSGGCPCYYILHHVVCCCQICVFSLLQPANGSLWALWKLPRNTMSLKERR